MRLDNKVCIVTGSTRGIGKEIALLFASEGADVIVNGKLTGTANEWIDKSDYKSRLHPFYFDVTDSGSVHSNIHEIKNQFGHIDVLVNNAGVTYNELIGMISRDHMEEMFAVNVYGVIEMIQATSRIMERNDNGGSIINISSIVGVSGNMGQTAYSATKGAVNSLTKSAAKELASKKVRVNAIAPGLTQTRMLEQADINKLQERIGNIRLGRIAQPKDIASGCLFLASDEASYITGQILSIDGCAIM